MDAHTISFKPGKGPKNRLILPIGPQTHVRVTQNDDIWFKIPELCPHRCGLPRRKTSKAPGCRHCLPEDGLARKKRILRYYEYKESLAALAKGFQFLPPVAGSAVHFFIPIPKRWPKQKRAAFHQQPHGQKPDLSNLLKAYEDALLKKDETIWQYSGGGKYWVDTVIPGSKSLRESVIGPGWIEVHMNLPIYDPKTETYTQ
jgi:hypothetical protein